MVCVYFYLNLLIQGARDVNMQLYVLQRIQK